MLAFGFSFAGPEIPLTWPTACAATIAAVAASAAAKLIAMRMKFFMFCESSTRTFALSIKPRGCIFRENSAAPAPSGVFHKEFGGRYEAVARNAHPDDGDDSGRGPVAGSDDLRHSAH